MCRSPVIAQLKCVKLGLDSPWKVILNHTPPPPVHPSLSGTLSHTHLELLLLLLKTNSLSSIALVAFAAQQSSEHHPRHLQV